MSTSSRGMDIRLLIVDDHDLVRTGFRLFLQMQEGVSAAPTSS